MSYFEGPLMKLSVEIANDENSFGTGAHRAKEVLAPPPLLKR
jgi:hypothetical protein